MIDINTALQNILKAIYGKDVRQSIHDAIYQINQNANEAIDLAQIKFGTDIIDPTSPVGDYIEGTVYFNVATGIIWKLSGGSWSQLGTMKTIDNIEKTSTSGLVDTYTISYNDGTTTNYTVTNGEKGTSVVNITKVSTTGNVDHYDVNLSDGTRTPNGFDVANGISITDISLESTVGNVKNYNVKLSDGSKTPTGFSIADGVSSYVYIRYSANFDGSGMVTVPSDQTVYIGICVTTQSTAPTDPAVYSWVRFIGKSGTGSGDMLASDYATLYAKTVDRAAALYDGNKEISADQLMDKSTYADADLTETVKKATTLVDKVNSKEADTEVLAKFSENEGQLQYNGEAITAVDGDTITRNDANELTLASDVTTKLQTNRDMITDEWQSGNTYAIGDYVIYENVLYKCIGNGGGNVTPNTSPSVWLPTTIIKGFKYVDFPIRVVTNPYVSPFHAYGNANIESAIALYGEPTSWTVITSASSNPCTCNYNGGNLHVCAASEANVTVRVRF